MAAALSNCHHCHPPIRGWHGSEGDSRGWRLGVQQAGVIISAYPDAPPTRHHARPLRDPVPTGRWRHGEVYKARDTRLDRTVAIKVLLAHVADDPDLRQRFEREAKTISSLNHPHICTLYDIGQQDGTDFLVMEYLEGETLAQRLQKGALPLAS